MRLNLIFPALLFPALLLTAACAALGQTTSGSATGSTAQPGQSTTGTHATIPVHHHHVAAHRTAEHRALHTTRHRALIQCAPLATAPVLPPGVPAAAGIAKTAFALRYIDIEPGTGAPMQPGDFLTVNYTGWLASTGMKFDSSLDRNEPFTFRQGEHRVIPGWDEGLNGMRVGGKRRLFIPWQLAYGELGRGPIPPKADLIFDIELLSASPEPGPPTPIPAPPQVNAQPQE